MLFTKEDNIGGLSHSDDIIERHRPAGASVEGFELMKERGVSPALAQPNVGHRAGASTQRRAQKQ
ncbi:MAG: hypothetical protein IPK83_21810 [Planctomycetes bacterium]|nr:hypothetical protein [Planctomycetota bacterium]